MFGNFIMQTFTSSNRNIMKGINVLISLYDHSGNQSKPYKDNGWLIKQVELKHGIDILTWDFKNYYYDLIHYLGIADCCIQKIGIICPTPCTDYALCGAKHFKRKDEDGTTEFSQKLVARNRQIISFFKETNILQFWYIENPKSRIHKLNPWMGSVKFKFNPCDFAGWVQTIDFKKKSIFHYAKHKEFNELTKDELHVILEHNAYNKETWLWGEFNHPSKNLRIEPPFKENPGWKLYGGKSERTKELRSVTPMGFCWAFYKYNH